MSVPLPLRLCSVVAMAPALTEATQAIKLPQTNTPASADTVTTGRSHTSDQAYEKTGYPREHLEITCDKQNETAKLPPVSDLNGNSLRSVDKQSPAFPRTPGSLTVCAVVPEQIKKLVELKDRGVSFQSEVAKKISESSLLCKKFVRSGVMNQPSTASDKEEEKCLGHRTEIRSNTWGERSGNCKVNTGSQKRAGSHLFFNKFGGSLVGEGNNPRPQAATNITNSVPVPVETVNRRQLQHTGMSKASSDTCSQESSLDGYEVDKDVSELSGEASRKQAQLERRMAFQQRRVHRLEARHVEQHIRQQRECYIDYQHQNLQTVEKSSVTSNSSLACQNGDDLKKELLSDGVKHMSTAALVNLVQKIQQTGSLPQLAQAVKPEVTRILNMSSDVRRESEMVADKLTVSLRTAQSALDSDATESSSGGETDGEDGPSDVRHPLPPTPLTRRAEWKWALERAAIASKWTWLQAQVTDLEYRIRQQTHLYRHFRTTKGQVVLDDPPAPQTAVCSYDGRALSTSSAIPLCSSTPSVGPQSSHLNAAASKCLSTTSSASSSHPTIGIYTSGADPERLFNIAHNSSRMDTPERLVSAAHNSNRVVIEVGGPVSHSTDCSPSPMDSIDSEWGKSSSARCRPLKHLLFKRKLVRTSELLQKSEKAARLSSVECYCRPAMMPCVLCCGKMKKVAQNIDPHYMGLEEDVALLDHSYHQKKVVQNIDPHYMGFQERVALLDHSYHQVLSFPEEVPLSVHFEGLLRTGKWQNKGTVRQPWAEHGQRPQKVRKLSILTDERKALLRKNAASLILQSAKIRNKYEHKPGRKSGPSGGKTLGQRSLSTDLKNINHSPFTSVGRGRGRKKRGQGTRRGYRKRSVEMSPASNDAGFPKEKEVRRRRGESAYDINSIVIPRSMASLTRVEKLEYKEIPTPCWRKLGEEAASEEDGLKITVPGPTSNGLIVKKTHEQEEVEDLTDDTYIQRHSRCEVVEKKRFASGVRLPHIRRRARAMNSNVSDPTHQDLSRPSTPNTPLSMGTQASMDPVEVGEEESNSSCQHQFGTSLHHSPSSVTLQLGVEQTEKDRFVSRLNNSGVYGGNTSTLGNMSTTSVSRQERIGSDSSVEVSEQDSSTTNTSSVKAWPLRQFPLTDEEVSQLQREDTVTHEEDKPRLTLRIKTLHLQPVGEDASQAGSSVSGSLPPSPIPSTSSASVTGDWDAVDMECMLDADIGKKLVSHPKAIKR